MAAIADLFENGLEKARYFLDACEYKAQEQRAVSAVKSALKEKKTNPRQPHYVIPLISASSVYNQFSDEPVAMGDPVKIPDTSSMTRDQFQETIKILASTLIDNINAPRIELRHYKYLQKACDQLATKHGENVKVIGRVIKKDETARENNTVISFSELLCFKKSNETALV